MSRLSVEPKAAVLLEKVHYLYSLKSTLERMSLACSFFSTSSTSKPAEASITTSKASEVKTNLFVFISEP